MAEELEIDAINLDDVDDIGGEEVTPAIDITKHPTDTSNKEGIESTEGTNVTLKFGQKNDDILDGNIGIASDSKAEEVLFNEVGTILKGRGFFADEEDLSIKSGEDLASAFDREVQSRLTDRQREISEYQNQGMNITEVSKIQSAMDSTNSITKESLEADENLASTLILAEMKNNGIDGTKYVQMFKDAGTLAEEGLKALGSRKETLITMLEKEKTRASDAKQAEIDAETTRIAQFDKSLDNKEIFGRKLTSNTVTKLKSLVNSTVAYTRDGQPMNAIMKYREENPIDFERAIAYLFLATNEFKDVKAFDRSAETRVSRQFKNAVSSISAADDIQTNTPVNAGGNSIIDINSIDDIV